MGNHSSHCHPSESDQSVQDAIEKLDRSVDTLKHTVEACNNHDIRSGDRRSGHMECRSHFNKMPDLQDIKTTCVNE